MTTTEHDESPGSSQATERGRERPTGRSTVRGVTVLVVPLLAWITSLAASYVLQDFTCTAYSTAGHEPPEQALLIVITAVNVVLLAITIACGVLAWRETRAHTGVRHFLGYIGVALAAFMAWGIILIAVNPFILGVCA